MKKIISGLSVLSVAIMLTASTCKLDECKKATDAAKCNADDMFADKDGKGFLCAFKKGDSTSNDDAKKKDTCVSRDEVNTLCAAGKADKDTCEGVVLADFQAFVCKFNANETDANKKCTAALKPASN